MGGGLLPAFRLVIFDPTPSPTVPEASRLWATVRRFVDSLHLKWDRFVVQYSAHGQAAVAAGLQERSSKLGSALGTLLHRAQRLAEETQATLSV